MVLEWFLELFSSYYMLAISLAKLKMMMMVILSWNQLEFVRPPQMEELQHDDELSYNIIALFLLYYVFTSFCNILYYVLSFSIIWQTYQLFAMVKLLLIRKFSHKVILIGKVKILRLHEPADILRRLQRTTSFKEMVA